MAHDCPRSRWCAEMDGNRTGPKQAKVLLLVCFLGPNHDAPETREASIFGSFHLLFLLLFLPLLPFSRGHPSLRGSTLKTHSTQTPRRGWTRHRQDLRSVSRLPPPASALALSTILGFVWLLPDFIFPLLPPHTHVNQLFDNTAIVRPSASFPVPRQINPPTVLCMGACSFLIRSPLVFLDKTMLDCLC
jgi:hypothetical protein